MMSIRSSGQVKLTAWLGASHLGAALVAIVLWLGLPRLGFSDAAALAVAVLGATLTGLLLTLPLRRNVELAVSALSLLSRGQATASLPVHARGNPLSELLRQVDAVSARERELAALRHDSLRRTGEAAAQAERNRLARDLHDSIKQQLYAINVSSAAALARWDADPAGARSAVEDARRSAQAAMAEMAALLQQLRPAPLAAAGLLDALREQADALAYRTGAAVIVDFGQPDAATTAPALLGAEQLPAGAEEAIFRIAQEAFANIARHARAAHVTLRLRVEQDALHLDIADDGQGFQATRPNASHDPAPESLPPQAGYGLAGMRDRAEAIGGRLEVTSEPGAGTHLALTVPLAQAEPSPESVLSPEVKALGGTARAAHWVAQAATVLALVAGLALIPRLAGGVSMVPLLVMLGVLAASTAVAAVGGSRTHRAMMRLTLALGADSPDVLRERREQHTRQMWLCLVAVLLLPAALIPSAWPQYPIAALAVGVLCALLAGVEIVRTYRAGEAYWSGLPAGRLAAEIEQAWSQRFTPLLVLAITVPGYLFLRFGTGPEPLAWPPSRELLIDILATIYLVLLSIWSVVAYAQLRRWRGLSSAAKSERNGA